MLLLTGDDCFVANRLIAVMQYMAKDRGIFNFSQYVAEMMNKTRPNTSLLIANSLLELIKGEETGETVTVDAHLMFSYFELMLIQTGCHTHLSPQIERLGATSVELVSDFEKDALVEAAYNIATDVIAEIIVDENAPLAQQFFNKLAGIPEKPVRVLH